MRSARLTYESAWHHVMNRGYEGKNIFGVTRVCKAFPRILRCAVHLYRIRVSAWCIMKNHYHMLLQNSSGRLSEFVKYLNSLVAQTYRDTAGGKGYVFQGRFKSTLIEEDEYWDTAFLYILLNPVRAGLAKSAWDYPHSSIHEYFSPRPGTCDKSEILARFPTKARLSTALNNLKDTEIKTISTRIGPIYGDEAFVKDTLKTFERRTTPGPNRRKRLDDRGFETTDAVVSMIEKKINRSLKTVDFKTYEGKRLRAQLLTSLKDRCGLRYSEIILLPWFKDLKLSSLGRIYGNAQNKRCRVFKFSSNVPKTKRGSL